MAQAGLIATLLQDPSLTPAEVERRRKAAEKAQDRASAVQPLSSPWQVAAQILQGVKGGWDETQAKAGEKAGLASRNRALISLLGGGQAPPPAPSNDNAALTSPTPMARAPNTMVGGAPQGDAQTVFGEVAPRAIADLSRDFNLPPEKAAAIIGPLGMESKGLQAINEERPMIPGSRGGFGWSQWTGPRRKQFEAFAAQNGLDPTSYEANYGFLKHELANTSEGKVLDAVRSAPDPMTASRAFTNGFLRPGIPNYAARDQWTQRALAVAGQGGAQARPAVYTPQDQSAMAAQPPGALAFAQPDRPGQMAGVDPRSLIQPMGAGGPPPMGGGQPAPMPPAGGPQSASLAGPPPMGAASGPNLSPLNQATAAQLTGGVIPPAPIGDRQATTGVDQRQRIAQLLSNPWTEDVGQQLLKAELDRQTQAADPYRQLQMQKLQRDLAGEGTDAVVVNDRLVNRRTGQVIADFSAQATGERADRGLAPVYGVDKDGNAVIMQLGKDGTAAQTALPPGVTLSKEPIRIDAGTETVLLDPITRQVIGRVPKNIAGAQAAEVTGKAQGEAQAGLPNALATADQSLATVDSILNDPALERGVGLSSILNAVPGTAGYDFSQKVKQLQGQTFLQAFNSLRGGGAITELEGQKAEQAIARLSTSQSEGAFKTALQELRGILGAGRQRAIDKARGSQPAITPPPAAPAPSVASPPDFPSVTEGVPTPRNKAEFDLLPSGSVFIAPDGSKRTKP